MQAFCRFLWVQRRRCHEGGCKGGKAHDETGKKEGGVGGWWPVLALNVS
jgi:hypothetical protein